jgi:hypothetical protein
MHYSDASTWSAKSRTAAAVAGALFMMTLGALFGVWIGAGHPHDVLQGLTDPVKPAKAARRPVSGHPVSVSGTTVTVTAPGSTVTTARAPRTVTVTQPASTVTETSTVTVTTGGTTASTASP